MGTVLHLIAPSAQVAIASGFVAQAMSRKGKRQKHGGSKELETSHSTQCIFALKRGVNLANCISTGKTMDNYMQFHTPAPAPACAHEHAREHGHQRARMHSAARANMPASKRTLAQASVQTDAQASSQTCASNCLNRCTCAGASKRPHLHARRHRHTHFLACYSWRRLFASSLFSWALCKQPPEGWVSGAITFCFRRAAWTQQALPQ